METWYIRSDDRSCPHNLTFSSPKWRRWTDTLTVSCCQIGPWWTYQSDFAEKWTRVFAGTLTQQLRSKCCPRLFALLQMEQVTLSIRLYKHIIQKKKTGCEKINPTQQVCHALVSVVTQCYTWCASLASESNNYFWVFRCTVDKCKKMFVWVGVCHRARWISGPRPWWVKLQSAAGQSHGWWRAKGGDGKSDLCHPWRPDERQWDWGEKHHTSSCVTEGTIMSGLKDWKPVLT